MRFRRLIALCISLNLMFLLVSCKSSSNQESRKITVVTTLFPQYDFVREIAKGRVNVELLLDAGEECSLYEPSPTDISRIENSDLFIYTGKYVEAWAQELIDELDNEDLRIKDLSSDFTLDKVLYGEENDDTEEQLFKYEPNFWTNPQFAIKMVESIADELSKADPVNADFYRDNANEYRAKLLKLDSDIETTVNNSLEKKIYFGGRFYMHYFFKRYDLEYRSLFDERPDGIQPTNEQMSEFISEMKRDVIDVVFYEEISDPKTAQLIANETGAKAMLFHSLRNLSNRDVIDGQTYLSLMEQNLVNLKKALG